MTQNNTGYQDLIINNGVISTISSDNSTLQGIQMNQFAICANPGSTPVLVPYIAPMILSPQTKITMDGNNQDNRSQNGNGNHQISINNQQNSAQIQLANNITIPSNMINSGNLPLGLSYINLSQLTSQSGGASFPIQFALNTGTNQQFTLPLASITQLTNEMQLSNAYTLTPQIKFEPELRNTEPQITEISINDFQKSIIKCEKENTTTEIATNKRFRKKVIGRKTSQPSKKQKTDNSNPDKKSITQTDDNDTMYDHKGRPFTYPCNQCSKKFTQNSRLTAHLRCHSGIRPYTCNQCGFSFTQKSYLIRHAAVHKEDRPFTCAKCLKTYKHYGSLANHRKLHCREMATENNLNGSHNHDTVETDDLDETIQQTIEAVQLNHHQTIQNNNNNNFILTYTTNNQSTERQSTPIVYFNNNNNSINVQSSTTLNELQLPGSGPVVFPSQELPSISAVSLLPTNRSAINELKAITTHLATNVDVDDIQTPTTVGNMDFQSHHHHHQNQQQQQQIQQQQQQIQHHIKQEPTYYNVTIRSTNNGN